VHNLFDLALHLFISRGMGELHSDKDKK